MISIDVFQVAHRVGWTIVHSAWLFAVITVLWMLIMRCLNRQSSHARYLAGCVALATMAISAVMTFTMMEPGPRAVTFADSLSEPSTRLFTTETAATEYSLLAETETQQMPTSTQEVALSAVDATVGSMGEI